MRAIYTHTDRLILGVQYFFCFRFTISYIFSCWGYPFFWATCGRSQPFSPPFCRDSLSCDYTVVVYRFYVSNNHCHTKKKQEERNTMNAVSKVPQVPQPSGWTESGEKRAHQWDMN